MSELKLDYGRYLCSPPPFTVRPYLSDRPRDVPIYIRRRVWEVSCSVLSICEDLSLESGSLVSLLYHKHQVNLRLADRQRVWFIWSRSIFVFIRSQNKLIFFTVRSPSRRYIFSGKNARRCGFNLKMYFKCIHKYVSWQIDRLLFQTFKPFRDFKATIGNKILCFCKNVQFISWTAGVL